MVSQDPYQSVEQILTPLHVLVAACAPSKSACIRTIFALDAKCAAISRGTHEVMIGQMRLAWWRDALAQEGVDRLDRGEPLIDALQGSGMIEILRPYLIAIVDGWEELIVADEHPDDAQLLAFARGRGGGLFGGVAAAMGVVADEQGADAGALWALWDLAGHVRDDALAGRAITLARPFAVARGAVTAKRLPRPLALLSRLAGADIARGRGAPPGMSLPLYLRVLRFQILGR